MLLAPLSGKILQRPYKSEKTAVRGCVIQQMGLLKSHCREQDSDFDICTHFKEAPITEMWIPVNLPLWHEGTLPEH